MPRDEIMRFILGEKLMNTYVRLISLSFFLFSLGCERVDLEKDRIGASDQSLHEQIFQLKPKDDFTTNDIEGVWSCDDSALISNARDTIQPGKCNRVELEIQRLSLNQKKDWAFDFPFVKGNHRVAFYGYLPCAKERHVMPDSEPGWIVVDRNKKTYICLGPMGSHLRSRVAYGEDKASGKDKLYLYVEDTILLVMSRKAKNK